ncbi:hypothetical protein BJY01DRAFT_228955 [Aspergillus pseudoustus]|uniref:Oxidase ustYa n=1 Tax=Aspergillus pseudoustus TaxID=1810923 RepID=A0ABR4IIU1_9EURO
MAPFCDGDESPTKKMPLLGDMMSYSMHLSSSDIKEAKYGLVGDDEHLGASPRDTKSPSRTRTAIHVAQTVALFAIAFVLGFVLCYVKTTQRQWEEGLLLPPGTTHRELDHDLTFSQRPNAETEKAWADIIPAGRGFIQHPKLAPAVSGLTVFHQLHCLHTIIKAYYVATEPADPTPHPEVRNSAADAHDNPDLNSTGTDTQMEPAHVRHCFDYLRQTIMCAADTNIEALEPNTRGTDGWGQHRVCRDYQTVFDWAEKWADPLERSRGLAG